MNNRITKAQAHAFAYDIKPHIKDFVDSHKAEYEQWLSDNKDWLIEIGEYPADISIAVWLQRSTYMNKKIENINHNTAYEQLTLEMFIQEAERNTEYTIPPENKNVETTLADTAELTDKV